MIAPLVSGEWLAGHLDEVVVVDVRSYLDGRSGRDAYAAGHLPGALLLPLAELPARAAELPAGRPLVVYCQRGGRSARAVALLEELGRPDVQDLAGGYEGWGAI